MRLLKKHVTTQSVYELVIHLWGGTLPYFHVSNNALFSTEYFSTLILYRRSIDTFYYDVIMGAMASQITSITIVYSTVYSDADQNKHQSSASLAFARGIRRGPVNFPHKWQVTRKMFPFDDVIMMRGNI